MQRKQEMRRIIKGLIAQIISDQPSSLCLCFEKCPYFLYLFRQLGNGRHGLWQYVVTKGEHFFFFLSNAIEKIVSEEIHITQPEGLCQFPNIFKSLHFWWNQLKNSFWIHCLCWSWSLVSRKYRKQWENWAEAPGSFVWVNILR